MVVYFIKETFNVSYAKVWLRCMKEASAEKNGPVIKDI